jgi:hypothetical protein
MRGPGPTRPVTHARSRSRSQLATALSVLALALAALAGCGGDPAAEAPPPGRSPLAGLQDDRLADPAVDPAPRVRRMAELGARLIRVDLRWDRVAPRRPARPRDPDDAAYRWRQYDRVVRAARRHRVSVMMAIWGTPGWAADRGVPASGRFPASATRPRDPADVGRFAAAAARRYGPLGVKLWEAWNEPNLPLFLRPQYARRRGRWRAVSPATYSRMLGAVYNEVKAVDPEARVGGGVTSPAGDRCPLSCPDSADDRVSPAEFVEALAAPANRPPMDAYAHHPYPLTPPRERTRPTASHIDLYNLGHLRERLDDGYLRGVPIWVTEVGFATASTPEYPLSFDEDEQARLVSDAYRRLRARADVELGVWYPLQDSRAWRSGLLRRDGGAKPAAAAFGLPAAPARQAPAPAGEPVRVVGQVRGAEAPAGVRLERREGGEWREVARVAAAADGSFAVDLRPERTGSYRAVSTRPAGRSAPFTVRVAA